MFLSALAYEADKEAAMVVGAQSYLVKPADIQLLSNEVEDLLASASTNAAEAATHSQASLREDAERGMSLGMRHLETATH